MSCTAAPARARAALLVLIVLAGAPAAALRAAGSEEDATAPASDGELTLLSRRLTARLEASLREACLGNARTAVVVRELESGQVLFRQRGDEAFIPASNQKILTAGAALALLGGEHVLVTRFRADRRPDAEGRVGRLYIVGGGDPSLNVESLYLAARALAAAGLRRVDEVVADDSFFDAEGRPSTWLPRNHRYWYGAPSSALSANYNVVAVHARVDEGSSRPRVWVDPFPSAFELVERVQAGRGPLSVASEVPAGLPPGKVQRLTASGRVRPGRSERVLRAVEDPAIFCAQGLIESLRRVGVEVSAPPRRGLTPPESVALHSQVSKPLALLLHDMNKSSSNVFAETLLKVLGAELLGPPGTRDKGLAVLEAYLASQVTRPESCRLSDGSGLSPENRLTATALTELLRALLRDPLVGPELLVTLPVAGVDGTLRRRLREDPARRLVRAKTGRLEGVVALSGLAPVGPERRALFSILVNDYHCPTWKVQDAVDSVVRAITAESGAAPDLRARLPLADIREVLDRGAADEREVQGGD